MLPVTGTGWQSFLHSDLDTIYMKYVLFTFINLFYTNTAYRQVLILQFSLFVHDSSRNRGEVTGGMFHIDFAIEDPAFVKTDHRSSLYNLKVT